MKIIPVGKTVLVDHDGLPSDIKGLLAGRVVESHGDLVAGDLIYFTRTLGKVEPTVALVSTDDVVARQERASEAPATDTAGDGPMHHGWSGLGT